MVDEKTFSPTINLQGDEIGIRLFIPEAENIVRIAQEAEAAGQLNHALMAINIALEDNRFDSLLDGSNWSGTLPGGETWIWNDAGGVTRNLSHGVTIQYFDGETWQNHPEHTAILQNIIGTDAAAEARLERILSGQEGLTDQEALQLYEGVWELHVESANQHLRSYGFDSPMEDIPPHILAVIYTETWNRGADTAIGQYAEGEFYFGVFAGNYDQVIGNILTTDYPGLSEQEAWAARSAALSELFANDIAPISMDMVLNRRMLMSAVANGTDHTVPLSEATVTKLESSGRGMHNLAAEPYIKESGGYTMQFMATPTARAALQTRAAEMTATQNDEQFVYERNDEGAITNIRYNGTAQALLTEQETGITARAGFSPDLSAIAATPLDFVTVTAFGLGASGMVGNKLRDIKTEKGDSLKTILLKSGAQVTGEFLSLPSRIIGGGANLLLNGRLGDEPGRVVARVSMTTALGTGAVKAEVPQAIYDQLGGDEQGRPTEQQQGEGQGPQATAPATDAPGATQTPPSAPSRGAATVFEADGTVSDVVRFAVSDTLLTHPAFGSVSVIDGDYHQGMVTLWTLSGYLQNAGNAEGALNSMLTANHNITLEETVHALDSFRIYWGNGGNTAAGEWKNPDPASISPLVTLQDGTQIDVRTQEGWELITGIAGTMHQALSGNITATGTDIDNLVIRPGSNPPLADPDFLAGLEAWSILQPALPAVMEQAIAAQGVSLVPSAYPGVTDGLYLTSAEQRDGAYTLATFDSAEVIRTSRWQHGKSPDDAATLTPEQMQMIADTYFTRDVNIGTRFMYEDMDVVAAALDTIHHAPHAAAVLTRAYGDAGEAIAFAEAIYQRYTGERPAGPITHPWHPAPDTPPGEWPEPRETSTDSGLAFNDMKAVLATMADVLQRSPEPRQRLTGLALAQVAEDMSIESPTQERGVSPRIDPQPVFAANPNIRAATMRPGGEDAWADRERERQAGDSGSFRSA